ncbi:hypothetical protein [Nocardioides ultimimeridianus]
MRPSPRITGFAAAAVVTAVAIPLLSGPAAHATGFTGGNLVVYRVGAPGGTLTNAAAPVFLDEYGPTGTALGSIAVPTVAADGNRPLTAAGQSRSEGLLSRSADGRYVAFTGYAAAPGTTGDAGASLTATSPATTPRVVGLLDGHGGVDTSTALSGSSAPSIVRSALTTNGDDVLATGGNGGILKATLGGASTTVTAGAADSNLNELSQQAGATFVSGILADRLSLSSGGTLTDVPGLPSNLLTYGYAVLDLDPTLGWHGTTADTIYLANASERAGTVDKYHFDGTSWTSAGSVDVPGATGLVADVQSGAVSLAVTTPTQLIALDDPTGASVSSVPADPQILATAPTGTEFRGVALAPTAAAAGPSVFVRTPTRGATVSISGTTVPVTAYVTGSAVSAVTVSIGSVTANATRGTGNLWTAKVPTTALATGAATLTVHATDSTGTTDRTRPVTLSGVPAADIAAGKHAPAESRIKRSGTWAAIATGLSPTRKGLTSATMGSKLTAYVWGSKVAISFLAGPKAGKVTITVDGRATTVDLYAASAKTLVKTFSFTGALKTHTVVVTVTGTKRAASHGVNVPVAVYTVS